jgi:hypothetical protein
MKPLLSNCRYLLSVSRLPAATQNSRRQSIRLSLLRPSDVMIASFPRSGNTWLRFLLSDLLLQTEGRASATRLHVHPDRLVPDFDRGDDLLDVAFDAMATRCIKTHLKWCEAFRRAIVIVRRPADCLVSYYHFQRRYTETRSQVEAIGIDRFCMQQLDSCLEHLESYLAAFQRDRSSFHFMTYEQLHAQPIDTILRACRFLGLVVDARMAERAVENHRFHLHAQAEEEAGVVPAGERFFRSGQVGSSLTELLPQTIRQIQDRSGILYDQAVAHAQAPTEATGYLEPGGIGIDLGSSGG